MKPWQDYARSPCYPDCSCEFMNSESWIHQPIAFWSSLSYLLPILFLHIRVKNKTHMYYAWVLVFVTLTLSSMFCHASFIRLSVAMDFASIGVIMGFFSFFHFTRMEKASAFKIYSSLIGLLILMIGGMYYLDKWTKIALCMLIFLFAFYEIYLKKGKYFLESRSLQLSILILVCSFLLFLMDDMKALCDPHGWVHGHTLWHIGTAWSAYYYGKWRFIDEKI